jgi:hypothetical protein
MARGSTYLRSALIVLLAATALPVLSAGTHAVAASDPQVKFTVQCAYTRSLPDDPIVFPGQAGASHLHDFFGNRSVDAFSTWNSMQGQSTSCANSGDTAGYWAPAVYLNGAKIQPLTLRAYYEEQVAVTELPPGLTMVAGNSHAFGPQSVNRVYFGCGSGSGTSKVDTPPDCSGGGTFTVHVIFPTCLNPLTSAVAYEPCPAGFTTDLPKLTERIMYPIKDARGIMLASGPAYTFHADFYNSWNQEALRKLLLGG